MDSVPADVSSAPPVKVPSTTPPAKEADGQASAAVASEQDNSAAREEPSRPSPTGISSWAKNLKISQPFSGSQDDSSSGNVAKSPFARFTSNLGLRLSPKSPVADDSSNESAAQSNLFGNITKGLVDSSKNAVKAVQVKARHVVSQNKRRYQVLFSFKQFTVFILVKLMMSYSFEQFIVSSFGMVALIPGSLLSSLSCTIVQSLSSEPICGYLL